MSIPCTTTSRPAGGAGGDHLVVAGLESIIDATAGIIAAQSLEATLQAMADALAPIVPYTSLVVYEVAWTERICIPLLATGSYVQQTLSSRPPLDDSATGTASINDAFGHGAGDETLRRFAEVLRTHTRAGDLVSRTGGEEFTVVLPRTDASRARRLAGRINEAVRAARLGPRADLTVSAGIATAEYSFDDFDRLVQRADGALLRAKRAGRDCLVVADAVPA